MNKDKVKHWIINNAVSIFQLVLPALVIIGTFILAFLKKNQVAEILLLLGLVLETLVLISLRIWNFVSYKAYRYPSEKIVPEFEFIKKRIYYEMLSDGKLRYSRTMKTRSLRSTRDSITDQYLWTGKVEAIIPVGKEHIRKIEPCPTIGIWRIFRITFDSPIEKGKELTYTYEWPLIDNCTSSSPFASVSTEAPTKEIEFCIKLGHKYSNKEVYVQEFRSIESASDQPLSQDILRFDEGGELHYSIKHPKRFRHYRVLWKWIE